MTTNYKLVANTGDFFRSVQDQPDINFRFLKNIHSGPDEPNIETTVHGDQIRSFWIVPPKPLVQKPADLVQKPVLEDKLFEIDF